MTETAGGAEAERLRRFEARVADRSLRLLVIGLGYVGLPVAATFASAGFRVTGLERNAERAAAIARGECPIAGDEPGLAALIARTVADGHLTATSDPVVIEDADVVIVCVDTPVETNHRPEYRALRSALEVLAPNLKNGALVIIESTLSPGTIDRVVRPALEGNGGATLFVGHCPERVMPGRLLANLRTMSRVCGGDSPATSRAMKALYRTIVDAELDEASCVVAELTKTAENTYRDVNIAFANELARVCESAGADFLEVRALVNKSPGRNVLMAGLGVGGHCIPKDPWLLAAAVDERTPLLLVPSARAVNDAMPLHVSRLVEEALGELGRHLSGARVAVLGFAYLAESDDERNSPSEALVTALTACGADVRVHDPFVARFAGSIEDTLRDVDAIVIAVAHRAYESIDWIHARTLVRTPALIDARFVITRALAHDAGFAFRGVGRAR
ncbi:MAG: nucleotide sugar dehydrogenase [Deltaproteobacteria bacterium]|nr:nucleotide sugar dehydrogenase [Deltaproteobacteria bacterium]